MQSISNRFVTSILKLYMKWRKCRTKCFLNYVSNLFDCKWNHLHHTHFQHLWLAHQQVHLLNFAFYEFKLGIYLFIEDNTHINPCCLSIDRTLCVSGCGYITPSSDPLYIKTVWNIIVNMSVFYILFFHAISKIILYERYIRNTF